MSHINRIIRRGTTLTGQKLRDAIGSATGTVIGGRGIRVSMINGHSVVSITGHTPRAVGSRGGSLVLRVTASDSPTNAVYSLSNPDGTIILVDVSPTNRMFDTEEVDFITARPGDSAILHALPVAPGVNPFENPPPIDMKGKDPVNQGGCVDNEDHLCRYKTSAECGMVNYLGDGIPCAEIHITEHVKISTCPTGGLPAGRLPAPPVISNAGLLA